MKTLENKVVLLTGASRGIGVHIAHALVSEGARIALVARNQQGLETVCRALKDRQATAESFSCDVTHMECITRFGELSRGSPRAHRCADQQCGRRVGFLLRGPHER